MNLWAISDLHVGYGDNRRAVDALDPMPEDWLILAGDVGETPSQLAFVLRTLRLRFSVVIWTPGNHELWTSPRLPRERRGVGHYERLVEMCRRYGVLTPDDPYPVWPGAGPRTVIVPTFLLYDYSFRPDEVPAGGAVAWAAEAGVRCADEVLLDPAPHASRADWCAERLAWTTRRLDALPSDARVILVNHWPLRYDHARLPRLPRFSIWCGTRATETWHRRYPIDTVVYGHMHTRRTETFDGVRFEEVSLGYPGQWNPTRPLREYLRKIR